MHRTIEDLIHSALDAAFDASSVPSLRRVPFCGDSPPVDPDALRRLRDRFVEETRPRYGEGYEAGVALAERLSWSQLSDLATHRWKVTRTAWCGGNGDLGIVFEDVLRARWGEDWAAMLRGDPIRARGLADALRDIWASVLHEPGSGTA